MPISEAPKELQEAVVRDPRLWIRNFLRHPEDPRRRYDFYDGTKDEYLWYLVDWSDGPLNPDNWGDINVLLFCRGGLKTWTATSTMAWAADVFPTFEGAATAPVDDQRYEVVERFKEKVEQSGLDERREKNKLSHQKFIHEIIDESGDQFQSYSHLKSRSAWGEGDKLRGIHGHGGVIDESQDVDEGTFTTFATEAIDREIPSVDFWPAVFVIGTPKMANSFFHKLWDMSDKKTWDDDADPPPTEDRDSGAWIQQDEPERFLPQNLKDETKELTERIEELESDDADNTDLIAEFEERIDEINEKGFTVRGWHLDQYNSPLHDEASVAFKKQTYSKKKFENEVLAHFYSPENDLITNDDVFGALKEGESFKFERESMDSEVVLGVDWGGGDGEGAAKTVITIAEVYEPQSESLEPTMDVLNVDVLDSSITKRDQRDQIDEYMRRYDVDVAVVDEGYGDSEREALQDDYGWDQRLYGCWFGNVKKKEEIVWNRFKNKKRFFTASKTYMVQKFAEFVKRGNVEIPKDSMAFSSKRDLGTRVVDQLTAPYTDRDETVTGQKKLRVHSDRADDIFDSFLYAYIAAFTVEGRTEPRDVFSHDRPGY